MLDELNPRTRGIVTALCEGGVAQLGDSRLGQFTEDERTLLGILASRLTELADAKGQDLVQKAIRLLDAGATEDAATEAW